MSSRRRLTAPGQKCPGHGRKRGLHVAGTFLSRLAAFGAVAFLALWQLFPYPPEALDHYPTATYLLDRNGRPMRMLAGPGDIQSDPVTLDASGEWAWKALVAVEDKRFFSHPGLDLLAIGRAATQNLRSGRVISGASTLSSQIIRMTEPRPRTLPTKLVEGLRALQMDAQFSKPAILVQYLNRAPMGGTLHGIAAASRAYFGKDPVDLDLAEAALLMGLPQSPSRFRPTRHPDRARQRRHTVLQRMAACGYITQDEFLAADQAPVTVRSQPLPFVAPHFCELARTQLAEAARPADTPHRIRTTIDPSLLALAEDALGRNAEDRRLQGVSGGAIVILEVSSGAVRALVGSPNFFDANAAGQVNGATALRSPGSTLKPFAYARAIDRGVCTAGSVVTDAPIQYKDYRPDNFDLEFNGRITVREALAQSLNIPALKITQAVGLDEFLALLRELGLTSIDRPAEDYGLSLVLGATEVSLLDLTAAYGALARGGNALPWRIWEDSPPPSPRPLLSPEAAYLVADILESGARLIPVCGHAADARVPRVAWKTGTSSGQRDAWTVAFNPEYVVGVWIGNPSGAGSPILVGAQTAAPIAYDIFRGLYPDGDAPWFTPPARLRLEPVCTESGQPPGPQCPITVEDCRIPGISNPAICGLHATAKALPPLRITSPIDSTHYRILAGLPKGQQAIALSASADPPRTLHWFVDGAHLGSFPANTPLLWPLEPGDHTITCADADGRSHSVYIHADGA